jgi:hypothetical protein
MSNVTHLPAPDPRRQARADFVAHAIQLEERSVRFVANKIGLSPVSLGDRLKGRIAFSAEDLEGIAQVVREDPLKFIARYLAVGSDGFEPPTSSVKTRSFGEVLTFRARSQAQF